MLVLVCLSFFRYKSCGIFRSSFDSRGHTHFESSNRNHSKCSTSTELTKIMYRCWSVIYTRLHLKSWAAVSGTYAVDSVISAGIVVGDITVKFGGSHLPPSPLPNNISTANSGGHLC